MADREGVDGVDESSLALDALGYVKMIAPLLLIIGAVSFADLIINFLIKLVKKIPSKFKW